LNKLLYLFDAQRVHVKIWYITFIFFRECYIQTVLQKIVVPWTKQLWTTKVTPNSGARLAALRNGYWNARVWYSIYLWHRIVIVHRSMKINIPRRPLPIPWHTGEWIIDCINSLRKQHIRLHVRLLLIVNK